MKEKIKIAAELIQNSSYTVAFTGAGISVESGIPPFRGEGGLWNEYDPMILDLNRYLQDSRESWPAIKRLFFDFFGEAKANPAHLTLADWEKAGKLQSVITQNIDNLHQEAGNENVLEYHGNCRQFVCTHCGKIHPVSEIAITNSAPLCPHCYSLLKPDFIFFGEGIPEPAGSGSIKEAKESEVFIIIGTSGEIVPASYIPYDARESGAKIIEINTEKSTFTDSISDVFLQGKAGDILPEINNVIKELS